MLRDMPHAGVAWKEGRVRSADGTELYWRGAEPAGEPRAAIALVHGLGEHVGRYEVLAAFLVGRGLAVFAGDLRGHGRSAGLRVHVDGFARYLDDLDAVVSLARERHPHAPLVVVGHSMGGLVAILHALRTPAALRGVAVSSPLLGVAPASRPPAALAALGRILNRLWPTCRFDNGVDAALLSRDPEVGRAYRADPLVSSRVSARWYASSQAAIGDAFAGAARMGPPVLILSAGADRLVDPGSAARWAALARPGSCEIATWPDMYHECFQAPDRGLVFARLGGWIEDLIDGSSSHGAAI